MFKKSIIMSMLMFLMVLSMSTGVFADDLTVVEEMPYYEVEAGMSEEVQAAIADINQVNAQIEAEITAAQAAAATLYANYQSNLAAEENAAAKAQLTAQYETEITSLISQLQLTAQQITLAGIERSNVAGIQSEIVFVDTLFGDRNAKIDPIIVVGW